MAPRKDRIEVTYYEEIEAFIEVQLRSNFKAMGRDEISLYWGIGELKANLTRMVDEHPVECACVKNFLHSVPPLNLDVFSLITDGTHFEILILEMKLRDSAGLKEWSQLIGYCLVSGAKYGLLVNIDNGASPRLSDILTTEENLSHIKTLVNGNLHEHYLGFMEWDSVTQNFEYSNLGVIKSLSELSKRLISEF